MEAGTRTGVHFGITSGVITTIGLITGLHSGTHSVRAIIGGILTIAVADAMSDALGIHISKEAEPNLSNLEVWRATLATFLAKFCVTGSFIVPILLLPLTVAVLVNVIGGLCILAALSFVIARSKQQPAWPVVAEHVGIALVVVVSTHYIGEWVSRTFS
jgi:vacuolar iron transporter family protein